MTRNNKRRIQVGEELGTTDTTNLTELIKAYQKAPFTSDEEI